MAGAGAMVDIAAFYTRGTRVLDAEERASLEGRLSTDYRRRLGRLRRDADRSETLAGLALLERSVAASGWVSPGLSRLEYPAGAGPRWPDGPRFSLAHTRGLVVCILTNQAGVRIGVDVERLRPIEPRVLRHVLDPHSLAALAERPAEALCAWTAVEAVLKAAGASLRRIGEMRLSANGSTATFEAQTWYLRSLVLPTGYVATVASDQPRFELAAAVAA